MLNYKARLLGNRCQRRKGRRVQASPEELNRWLGHDTSEPVQILTESTDLSAQLKRGFSYVRGVSRLRGRAAGVP